MSWMRDILIWSPLVLIPIGIGLWLHKRRTTTPQPSTSPRPTREPIKPLYIAPDDATSPDAPVPFIDQLPDIELPSLAIEDLLHGQDRQLVRSIATAKDERDYERAFTQLQQLGDDIDDPEWLLARATTLLQQRQFEAAAKCLTSIQRKHPTSRSAKDAVMLELATEIEFGAVFTEAMERQRIPTPIHTQTPATPKPKRPTLHEQNTTTTPINNTTPNTDRQMLSPKEEKVLDQVLQALEEPQPPARATIPSTTTEPKPAEFRTPPPEPITKESTPTIHESTQRHEPALVQTPFQPKESVPTSPSLDDIMAAFDFGNTTPPTNDTHTRDLSLEMPIVEYASSEFSLANELDDLFAEVADDATQARTEEPTKGIFDEEDDWEIDWPSSWDEQDAVDTNENKGTTTSFDDEMSAPTTPQLSDVPQAPLPDESVTETVAKATEQTSEETIHTTLQTVTVVETNTQEALVTKEKTEEQNEQPVVEELLSFATETKPLQPEPEPIPIRTMEPILGGIPLALASRYERRLEEADLLREAGEHTRAKELLEALMEEAPGSRYAKDAEMRMIGDRLFAEIRGSKASDSAGDVGEDLEHVE